jgi:prevent-host-death family protein
LNFSSAFWAPGAPISSLSILLAEKEQRAIMTTMTNSEGALMTQIAKAWTLADAKAHLSEVVESALKKGPQVITRHGRKAVVVVAVEEWERKAQRQGTLADFFAASPLRDSGLEIERPQDGKTAVLVR